MIAVIADDFTGAAEIGGIAVRNGFTVKIDTEVKGNYTTDIVVISTNTRSLDADSAVKQIQKLTAQLILLKPDLIFKKIDSLLRGRVGLELVAQLEIMKKGRALLIPSNPSLSRTIQEGVYYIDRLPLMESSFFKKIVHRATSSNALELLGNGFDAEANVLSAHEKLPPTRLIILSYSGISSGSN